MQRRSSGDDNAQFPQAVHEALKNPALWEGRPRDISFLLDSLPGLPKRVAGLNGKIDTNRISFITAETVNSARSSQAAAILGYTNSASLAFWDAYLKEDPSARRFLQSDALERSSHGAARLLRR